MGSIYVLTSLVSPGVFGSAAGARGEAVEDSMERPGNFPSCRGVACFSGMQRALLFTGLRSRRQFGQCQVSKGSRCWEEAGLS